MLKDVIKKSMEGSVLYSPLRDAYQIVLNRAYRKHRKQMGAFYAQFFSKGDRVFDIGANVGSYSEIFLRLGARVVAVEPNPECVAKLKARMTSKRLVVECAAVGSRESRATLFLCDDSDTHSTLSSEWIGVARKTPRLGEKHWSQTVDVRVTTLDNLIAKYGEPRFIKIDVEGFEREVLSGLSRLPRCLSFEFICEFLDAAVECVKKDCFSPRARFNLVVNDPAALTSGSMRLKLSQWVAAKEMICLLRDSSLRQAKTYGEIFVRENS